MKSVTKKDKTKYSTNKVKRTRLSFVTDDNIKYVFWLLEWYNYPVYSHREYREDSDKDIDEFGEPRHVKSGNYNLPTKIKEDIWEEYGGYYMADGEVGVETKTKRGYTVIRPRVGDMYPLRTP